VTCKARQLLMLSPANIARVGSTSMANSQCLSALQKEGHNERPIATVRRARSAAELSISIDPSLR
jgi:hypothetical protein